MIMGGIGMGNIRVFRSIGISFALILLFATLAFAAMGEVQNFTFDGFGPGDTVGPGDQSGPDGEPDARFSARISGFGALTSIMLKSVDGESIWDTTPGNGIWGMEVRDSSGEVLSGSKERLPVTPFLGGMGIEISVAGNGAIAKGGEFTLTVQFIDNSKSSATLTLKPIVVESRVSLLSARWGSKGPRDLTGKNENLRGDGTPDDRVHLELDGEGTLVSLEVNNIAEGKSTAMWDTIPDNGRWAIAVVEGNKILNRPDGSIKVDLTGRTDLDLWMTDNGKIGDGRNRFETILRFSDGSHQRVKIKSPETEPETGQSKGLEVTFMGKGDRDIVGRNERLSGNGKTDWRVGIVLESSGTVVEMKVTNVKGPDGGWDTIPENGKWLLAVTRPNGEVLNRSNGSIRIPVTSSSNYVLWLEDNESLVNSETRSVLTVIYDDGRKMEQEIQNFSLVNDSGDGDFLEAMLAGTGNADYVGKGEDLHGNQSRDSRFDIRFRGAGTLKAIRLINLTKGGEWDTVPGNGKWLIAVKQSGGSILNSPNGSIRLSIDGTASLELWVEDNGTLDDPDSVFRVSLMFSNGQVLEKNIPSKGSQGPNLKEDRELVLSKPWKAQSDYVGTYDQMKENGKGDWVFTLKIKGKGTVKSMSLREITGSGVWDTIPGNGRWALAVRGPGNRLLNNSNGSVSFPVPPNHDLHIFVEDNGSFKLERLRYEVTVNWDDGTSTKAQSQE